jgi:AcrR family transcriptional regulator
MKDAPLAKPAGRYHHGALRQALLAAAARLIEEGGVEALSLRACARMAGVASSAVFRHFPDGRALLTAYAAEGWEMLAEAILRAQAAAPPHPAARFGAVGLGYCTFALAHPNRFRVMFRHGPLDRADAALRTAEARVAALLDEGMAPLVATDPPAVQTRKGALAWALAHGVSALMVDGPLAETVPEAEREAFVRGVIRLAGPVFGVGAA